MEKILKKDRLSDWVAKLDSYNVYAPAFGDEGWVYEAVEDAKEAELDFPRTIHSPKNLVFPQREVLFSFKQEKGQQPELTQTIPDPDPFVVFGVRACDAKGLTLTDVVFSKEFEDPYYWARRNKGVFVGLACNEPPSPACFCLSVEGSPHGEAGMDAQMTDLGDRYYVKALTGKGKEIVKLGGALFKDAAAKDKKDMEKAHALAEKHPQRAINGLKGVEDKLRSMFEASDFWDDGSKACIQCGICTFLCPTCHCFDMNDEVSSSAPLKGERVRTWDTCQFPEFTMHSSGHNPRPDNASRLRQRVCHKFQYFFENHGEHQCTGCGRCVSECPVGIDIVATVNGASDYDG
ncbi:MAG TPA: sulfite reductase [Rhodospirillales bacterium]|nr:sulfite reductase [Rhodospirillales bacterium]